MSELKAYIGPAPDEKGLADYYLKSEADKVIAEKDAEIARLEATPEEIMKEVFDKVLIYPHDMVRLEDAYKLAVALRRSNRKRCVAMAKWCKARYDEEDAKVNGRGASWDYISQEMKYWERWQWRWEELAEEPTWAKFLQLIHKGAK